ncbi:GDSL-type esterase/lipase family protein [Jiangella asiatica]|uniref:SGNH hydrolase-type esterase domain-containing protein n=1 Tax=Jiangella asiatica TaxID=2530372 RepID=A0A4R5DNQ0_9ACTN|nr:GDSL-type esterase/lipase family protein [Jiangella asiatica]TDE15962.1 hypothetical protein E1269_01325 [Jiangella asiatica]
MTHAPGSHEPTDTRSSRSIRRKAVALCAAAFVVVGLVPTATAAAAGGAEAGVAAQASVPAAAARTTTAAEALPDAVVALGDSYSSGLGAGGYQNHCDHTPQAWIHLLFGGAVADRTLLACSGATISDVATQVGQLAALPGESGDRLITVTVGGNDAGFADELVNCLVSFVSCTSREAALTARIQALHQPLVDLYNSIQAAAPGDEVIVGGYPMLVPDPAVRSDCPALTSFLSTSERRMIRRLGVLLNDVVDGAAAAAGVRSASSRVEQTFDGHEACANGAGDWLYGLKLSFGDGAATAEPSEAASATPPSHPQWEIVSSFVRDSFHPTVAGQAGYASAFEAEWAAG